MGPNVWREKKILQKFTIEWNKKQAAKKEKDKADEKAKDENEEGIPFYCCKLMDNFFKSWREKKKKMDSVPQPGIFVTAPKSEHSLISLDGLLDYNENDKLEETFEVSLFAELYHEYLCRDFGNLILRSLVNLIEKETKKDDPKTVI